MNRRRYLSLLAAGSVGAITGCLSSDGAGTSSDPEPAQSTASTPSDGRQTTDRPASTTGAAVDVETPEPGACDAEAPPSPSTRAGIPDPNPYPERPDRLDRDPVTTFLEEYEAAYRYNSWLVDLEAEGNCVRYMGMYATGSSLSAAGGGFTASISTRGSFTGTPCPDVTGTDTETPIPHYDLPEEAASYYVTDRFLVREGTVVECW